MGILTNIKCTVKNEPLEGRMVSYDLCDEQSGRVVYFPRINEEQSLAYLDFLSALTEVNRETEGYFMLTGELDKENDKGIWLDVTVSGGRVSWCPHTGASIDIF